MTAVHVDPFYTMDPELDDLLRGVSLKDGMIVLLEDIMFKETSSRDDGWANQRRDETNQWCEVTEMTTRERFDYDDMGSVIGQRSPLISFIGVYPDGVKRTRTYDGSISWIVRKFSM